MATVKKEKNGFGWAFPAKLLVGALLCLALTACGGGGGGSSGGPKNDPIDDPGDQSSAFSCEKLRLDQHDGVCVEADGIDSGAFYRQVAIEYRPDGTIGDVQYHVSSKTAPYLGGISLRFPLNKGSELTCADPGVMIDVVWKADPRTVYLADFENGGSCDLSFSSDGRLITGRFTGTVVGKDNTKELTNGYFRISLEGPDDFIAGIPSGSGLERDLKVVDIDRYLPEKGVIWFSAYPKSSDTKDDDWEVRIADLNKPSPAICSGERAGNSVSYRGDGDRERDRVEDFDTCEITYEINDGVLTGSFSGDVHKGGTFKVSLPDGPLVDNL